MSSFRDTAQFFVQQARRSPRLDRERELELASRWRDHADVAAADTLVRATLGLVVATVRRYRWYGLPEADLIAEGNFGVVQALGKFDPDRGVRFSTYASHWIRASLLDYIAQSWSTVGAGRGVLGTRMFFRIRRERALVASYLGAGQGADEAVAARIGVTTSAFADMASRLDARDLSLDAPIAGDPRNWGDVLASSDDQERELSEREVERSLASAVELATRRLDARERCIVEQRLLANPEDAVTLVELGRQLGVSSERARQLEQRTMSKLRTNIAACADPVASEWLGHLTG